MSCKVKVCLNLSKDFGIKQEDFKVFFYYLKKYLKITEISYYEEGNCFYVENYPKIEAFLNHLKKLKSTGKLNNNFDVKNFISEQKQG